MDSRILCPECLKRLEAINEVARISQELGLYDEDADIDKSNEK